MPDNNYNYGESYIVNSDKESVDNQAGVTSLYREKLEFDTRATTDVLTENMPKKQTKATVEASVFKMAEERDY